MLLTARKGFPSNLRIACRHEFQFRSVNTSTQLFRSTNCIRLLWHVDLSAALTLSTTRYLGGGSSTHSASTDRPAVGRSDISRDARALSRSVTTRHPHTALTLAYHKDPFRMHCLFHCSPHNSAMLYHVSASNSKDDDGRPTNNMTFDGGRPNYKRSNATTII